MGILVSFLGFVVSSLLEHKAVEGITKDYKENKEEESMTSLPAIVEMSFLLEDSTLYILSKHTYIASYVLLIGSIVIELGRFLQWSL